MAPSQRPLRVALASHFYPPEQVGGAETYTHALAAALRRAGHEVAVLTGAGWRASGRRPLSVRHDEYEGVPVTRLQLDWTAPPDPFRYAYDNPEVERFLLAYLPTLQPDVLHVTSCYTLSSSVLAAAQQLGIPTVVTLVDFWFICPRHTLLRGDGTLCDGRVRPADCLRCLAGGTKLYHAARWALPAPWAGDLLLWVGRQPWLSRRPGLRGLFGDYGARARVVGERLARADRAIAPSRFLKQVMLQSGALPPRPDWEERMVVLPYGLEDAAAAQLAEVRRRREAEGRPAGGLRVLYVGQISPIKGVEVLLRAFRQLPAPDATLTIHGDPTLAPGYVAELRALAEGDPRIRFAGRFERAEVGRAYAGGDVLVVPSRWYENTPLVVAEAFAAGLPVVATNLGGMSEVVLEGENGLLFPRDDAAALAGRLRRLAEDPQLLARLRAGVRPPPSLTEQAARIIDLYRSLEVQPAWAGPSLASVW